MTEEDIRLLEFENKMMAEFLVSIGVNEEMIGEVVINGSEADRELLRKILKGEKAWS